MTNDTGAQPDTAERELMFELMTDQERSDMPALVAKHLQQ